MIEIRELLRRWQRGDSYRKVADAVGIDRKTVWRYVEAAQRHGFARGGDAVVSDELVGTVVAEVSPGAPPKIGGMRQLCRDHRDLLLKWRSEGCQGPKLVRLLQRQTGVKVPIRTMRRFLAEELGKAGLDTSTVRIVEPPPGQVLEIDFMELGRLVHDGEERKLYALIAVAAYSRHTFVWPCLTTTAEDVIEGLEAAWAFFGGVFPVVVADNPKPIVIKADPLSPVFHEGFAEYAQARGFVMDQARVRCPKDKPKVERTVSYVRRDGAAGERYLDLGDANSRIFVALEPVDMQGSFDALVGHVRRLAQDPLDGHLYFFVNRRKRLMKMISFERSGWRI
ncbi:MAG: IS66 family insertion sequence element accessory protein TnpB [Myxococcota bacterium]